MNYVWKTIFKYAVLPKPWFTGKMVITIIWQGPKNPLKKYLPAAVAGRMAHVTTVEQIYQDSLLQSYIRYKFEVSCGLHEARTPISEAWT